MSNNTLLDEPADIHAEIGTKMWARGLARAIRCNAEKLDSDVQHIQDFIRIAAEHDAWKVLGYVSLDAFLISEANFTEAIIEAIRSAKSGTVADAIERAEGKKDKGKTGPKINGDSIKYEQGTTNENILRRLARDHEFIFAKVKSGELSVNAAAIQAGIRKKPTPEEIAFKSFCKASDRLATLKKIVSELTEYEKQVILEWLTK